MLFKNLISLLALQQISGNYNYSVNDPCILNHDRSPGICKSDYCQLVDDLLKCRGIKPTTCGFNDSQPIVCCPINNLKLKNCENLKPENITERISVSKCREYKKCSVKRPKYKLPPNVHAAVGGIDAYYGQYPHMAALGWLLTGGKGYSWNCGGSLISENYVITAAHCTYSTDSTVQTPQPTMVRLGELNFKTTDDSKIQDISISSIIKHPRYKQPNKYHDIALIKLVRSVVFDLKVRPICLWQTKNIHLQIVDATGWGRLGLLEDKSDILQTVTLNIIDQKICKDFYSTRKRKLSNGIIDEQICAGDLNGGKDTCQGDSGGPLQIKANDSICTYHLIGITSFGVGCGGKNSPAVYTRVSSYIDWIESVVWSTYR